MPSLVASCRILTGIVRDSDLILKTPKGNPLFSSPRLITRDRFTLSFLCTQRFKYSTKRLFASRLHGWTHKCQAADWRLLRVLFRPSRTPPAVCTTRPKHTARYTRWATGRS
ncbi:hypothetical protein AB1N83_006200 [Pleurotus pulmonarius]